MLEFKFKDGFPVLIDVNHYDPFRPGKFQGDPLDCYPDKGPECEYELFLEDGRPAPAFVYDKVTAEESDRIDRAIMEAL